MPSYEALGLHWKRCTWVGNYWGQATNDEILMPGSSLLGCVCKISCVRGECIVCYPTDLSSYGWERENERL